MGRRLVKSCESRKLIDHQQSAYLERVNRAIDYIVDRISEPLRLGEVARAARLSPFHFHRIFQALLGETPGDFVKRLRLEKALGMMAHARPESLTSIALACGFASSSDFSRCFKRRFGVAPSVFDIDAWRQEHADALAASIAGEVERPSLRSLPPRHNPDQFRVRIRDLPARTVAYILVARPYEGDAVIKAIERLMAWAERHGFADSQWLGYQWDRVLRTQGRNRPLPISIDGYWGSGDSRRHQSRAARLAMVLWLVVAS
jgi:AraC family transcriptional regulator